MSAICLVSASGALHSRIRRQPPDLERCGGHLLQLVSRTVLVSQDRVMRIVAGIPVSFRPDDVAHLRCLRLCERAGLPVPRCLSVPRSARTLALEVDLRAGMTDAAAARRYGVS